MLVSIEKINEGLYKFTGIKASKNTGGKAVYLGKINLKAKSDFGIDITFDWLEVNELANDLGKSSDIGYLQNNLKVK